MECMGHLFLVGLLIVSWGRIMLRLSPHLSLSLGGTTTAVVAILFFLNLITRWRSGRPLISVPWRSPLFVFTALAAISILWCPQHDVFFFTSTIFPAFLAYLVARDLCAGERDWWSDRLLPVLFIGALLMVLRGVIETSDHLMAFGELDTRFEHHTLLAMTFSFLIPLVIAAISRNRARALFYGIILALMIFASVLCGSRVGLVTLFLVLIHSTLCFSGKKMRLLGGISMVLGVVFLFLLPVTHQRFAGLLSLGDDPYLITRTRIWDMSLSFVGSHPLLGLGFSNRAFLEAGKARFGEVLFFYEHPHNLYLQVFALLGIAGVIVFLWLAADIARKIMVLAKSGTPAVEAFGKALSVSFTWFLFMNLVEGAFNSARLMLMLFVMLAVVDDLFSRENRENVPSAPQ